MAGGLLEIAPSTGLERVRVARVGLGAQRWDAQGWDAQGWDAQGWDAQGWDARVGILENADDDTGSPGRVPEMWKII